MSAFKGCLHGDGRHPHKSPGVAPSCHTAPRQRGDTGGGTSDPIASPSFPLSHFWAQHIPPPSRHGITAASLLRITSLCPCCCPTWTLLPVGSSDEKSRPHFSSFADGDASGRAPGQQQTHAMIQTSCAALPHRNHLEGRPVLWRTQARRGTKQHARHRAASHASELLACDQGWANAYEYKTRNELVLFQTLAVKCLLPSFPPNPQRHIICANMLQTSRGQGVWQRLRGWPQPAHPLHSGRPRGAQHSPHSPFLMGCNGEHVCFKPISELPALNPNSFFFFFKAAFIKLQYWIRFVLLSVPGILSAKIPAQSCTDDACLCCLHGKGNKGAETYSFLFFSFSPFLNQHKIVGWYSCLILNPKQSNNSELEKSILIFG